MVLHSVVAISVAATPALALAMENHAAPVDYPGAVHAGYLGVGIRDVGEDRVAALKLKDAHGVEVVALDHDGPAAKAGVREHDVIVRLNGQEVASEEQLRRMLRETPAGRRVDLLLSRDGQDVTLQVVLGDRSTVEHAGMPELPQLNLALAKMGNLSQPEDLDALNDSLMDMGPGFGLNSSGAQVEALGPQLAKYFGAKDGSGVLVKDVRADSAAAKAGLRAGDVIVRADGNAIASRSEWERCLRTNRGKAVPVEVLRDKHPQKLTLTVAAGTQGKLSSESFVIEMPEEVAEVDATALAEVQKQMNSPAFQKEMDEARDQAAKAAAEWQQNGAAMQAEIARAGEEAKHAAEQWKLQQPEIDKQVREAMEQLQVQVVPFD